MGKSRKYIEFKKARDIIQSKNFKSRKDFRKYLLDNNILDVPSNPEYAYKSEWISLDDWLGRKSKSNNNIKNLEYEEAEIIVHKILFNKKEINSKSNWIKFYEDNLSILKGIPKYPQIKYKYSGWISWSRWLNVISKSDKREYTIDEVRKIIVDKNITTRHEYYSISKQIRLPSNPIYKFNLESWRDLLCKRENKKENKNYLSYESAKKVVEKLNISSQKEWYRLSKENKLPKNVPKTPNKYYENWISWNDWLGHSITTNKKFISYKDAKRYLSNLGITSLQEYHDYLINNQIDFLPLSPSSYYGSEYISTNDFLSNKGLNISYGEKKIISYLEDNGVEYIHQYKFEDCKHINNLIFDFYIPNENTCIEFDGRQHFEPIQFFGGQESFESLRMRDEIKNEYCSKNNIKLCRISYEDINIVNKILSDLLSHS